MPMKRASSFTFLANSKHQAEIFHCKNSFQNLLSERPFFYELAAAVEKNLKEKKKAGMQKISKQAAEAFHLTPPGNAKLSLLFNGKCIM